jgi:hypothetical protein
LCTKPIEKNWYLAILVLSFISQNLYRVQLPFFLCNRLTAAISFI